MGKRVKWWQHKRNFEVGQRAPLQFAEGIVEEMLTWVLAVVVEWYMTAEVKRVFGERSRVLEVCRMKVVVDANSLGYKTTVQ